MKTLWKVVAALLICGILFIIIGTALGANNRGLYINENGINLFSEKTTSTKLVAIEKITEIDIDMISSNIYFVIAEDYSLEIFNNNMEAVEYSLNNGKLTVRERASIGFSLFTFNWKEEYVKVYLPPDAEITSIGIKNTSGDVSATTIKCHSFHSNQLSGNLKLDNLVTNNLTVSNTSGNVTFNQVEVEQADISITSGYFRARDFQSQALRVKTTSGDISISGVLLGSSNFTVTSGSIKLEIQGVEQDYNRDIRVISGSVSVNGQRGSAGRVDFKADNSLDINVTSGSVKLNFTK